MTDVAIRPGLSKAHRTFVDAPGSVLSFYGKKYNNNDYPSLYGTTKEYKQFLLRRRIVIALVLVVPVAFIWLSLFSLIAYVALGLVPVIISKHADTLSGKYNDLKAYGYYKRLKQGWAEHGLVFYQQVWNHDCDGNAPERCYCYSKCSCPKRIFVACDYCDKRIIELRELWNSQNAVESKASTEVSEPYFEASKYFRQSIEGILENRESKIMEEISASVTSKKRSIR